MKRIVHLILICIFFSPLVYCQTVGINNPIPDTSAILDIKSAGKGLLIPRTSTTSRLKINKPAKGLLIYDTTTNSFWYNDSTLWKEIRTDSSGMMVGGLIHVTKQTADALISTSSLLAGSFYAITGVDTIYNDGSNIGTTIILQAINATTFSESGTGIFYNPKYNIHVDGFGIWNNRNTWLASPTSGTFNTNELITADNGATGQLYSVLSENTFIAFTGNWATATSIIGNVSLATASVSNIVIQSYVPGSKVIWGGYSWTNVNGKSGASIDLLHLDLGWTKDVYDTINYNLSIDDINCDFKNNFITRRYEANTDNEVSWSYVSSGDINPQRSIAAFLWGCENVHGNRVIAAYAECINFQGYIFALNNIYNNSLVRFNSFTKHSSFHNNNLFANSIFENNILTDSSVFRRNIMSSVAKVVNSTFANKSFVEYNNFSGSSYMINSTFANLANFAHNTLSVESYLNGNIVTDTASIEDNSLIASNFSNLRLLNRSALYNNIFTKQSSINTGLTNPLSGVAKRIQSITAEGGTVTGNVSAATLIFATYPKTLYVRPDGVSKLRYYNNNDVMVIANITD